MQAQKARSIIGWHLCFMLSVSACGGGAGGAQNPTPTPSATVPSPITSPTPTPTVTVTPGRQGFPATGQTTCWDTNGTLIDCDSTGQDGEIQAGGALAYTDNGDGTITDLNTHLMWEKKSLDGSMHNMFHSYRWADAFNTFIGSLNGGSGFAGHTDWRLPNVKELQSIIDYGIVNDQNLKPLVVAAEFNTKCASGCTVTACSCTQSGFYWSSTTFADAPSSAWSVSFANGSVSTAGPKTRNFYVRAVRGGS